MSDTCRIRAMRSQDLPMVLNWRNHPDVRRFMITQHEIGLDEHQNWFEKASRDSTRRLLIAEEAGNPIGYAQLANATPNGAADWGFYSDPNAPKGTGRKLGTATLNHAFFDLQLHKVCGQALAFNVTSIRFHLSLGFAQEGILRDQHLLDGAYHHLVCFGLLRHEWPRP